MRQFKSFSNGSQHECIEEVQARIITLYENYKCWRGIRYYGLHETYAKNSFNAIVYKQPPLLVNISS